MTADVLPNVAGSFHTHGRSVAFVSMLVAGWAGHVLAAADPTAETAAVGHSTSRMVFKGEWAEVRPFHQAVFSVAAGSQLNGAIRDSPTRKAADIPWLGGVLKNMAPPVFRLPGGDRLNHHDYFADPISLAEWRRMAQLGGSVPLWGVNVTTAPIEHTERMARTLVDLGAAATHFELGNELYLERWKTLTATAGEYVTKAGPHAAVLRRYFPQAKLGSPGASFWGLVQEGRPDAEFRIRSADQLHPWLRDLLAMQDLYDAIVLHLYLTPREFGLGGLKHRTPDELARWIWVRSDAELLKKIFGTVHALAPTKEIWVTEWAFNASQYIAEVKEVEWQVHQTMLAMLYDARFMLNVAYHVPSVTIMTCWTLYSQAAVCIVTSAGETTAKYELYRLLRWAREGCDGLARMNIENNPVWRGPAGGQGYENFSSEVGEVFGFFKGGVLQSAVILNILDREIGVEIPAFDRGLKGALALTQGALLPGWGNPVNLPVTKWNPPAHVREIPVERGRVTVPPHSIAVVHTARAID